MAYEILWDKFDVAGYANDDQHLTLADRYQSVYSSMQVQGYTVENVDGPIKGSGKDYEFVILYLQNSGSIYWQIVFCEATILSLAKSAASNIQTFINSIYN